MSVEALNILILDDDRSAANFTARVLDRIGVKHAAPVSSMAEASRLLADQDFDLVITALHMQTMETADLLSLMSGLEHKPHLVFLEGGDEDVLNTIIELVSAHKLSLLGTLSKPVKKDDLQTLLQSFEGRQRPRTGSRDKNQALSVEDLRAGIEKGYLFPYFQPKVEIKSGELVGVECLARWQDPERSLVFPDQFIPVAEKHGLITALTRSIFAQAMEQAAEWQVDGLDIKVSVNASMDDLEDKSFADFVLRAAEDAGVAPDRVQIEVTETKIMSDIKAPLATLTKLRNKGVGVSIDDYGTGFSSLKQLSQVPATELKVDREFVFEAWKFKDKRVILESSIHMGKKLGLVTVAEGAETLEDWRLLEKLGCTLVQGYFCAKPMAASALIPWYESWQKTKPEPVPGKADETVPGPVPGPQKDAGRIKYLVIAALIFAVSFLLYDRTEAPEEAMQAVIVGDPVIAVLPFVNMSSDPEQAYFSDGISEEILNVLARTDGLRVVARTSSFQYKDTTEDITAIAAALNANIVLEGSVRKGGDRVRITAQLIDAATGLHLWSNTYDRELTDIFAVQDEISQNIATSLLGAVGIEALPDNRFTGTSDMAAYNSYLRANALKSTRNRENLAEAVTLYEEAVARAPDFADAWAGLAKVRLLVNAKFSLPNDYESIDEAADHALAIDPENGQALAVQGIVALNQMRFREARQLLERAIIAAPTDPDGHFWMAMTLSDLLEVDAAIKELEIAMQMDPANVSLFFQLWDLNGVMGKFDQVYAMLDLVARGETLFKEALAISMRPRILFAEGRDEEAKALMQETRQDEIDRARYWFYYTLAARSGDPARVARARELLERRMAEGKPVFVFGAFEWLELGEEEKVREAFIRALEDGVDITTLKNGITASALALPGYRYQDPRPILATIPAIVEAYARAGIPAFEGVQPYEFAEESK